MNWTVDPAGIPGVLTVTVGGAWDISDATQAMESMWAEQARTGTHRVLWDLRELEAVGVSTENIREIAGRQVRERPDLPHARAAIVVSRDLAFGLGRMIEALLLETPVELQVFRELPVALEWLKGEPEA